MTTNSTGTLTLKVITADLAKDRGDLIGKQDPYCIIHFGNQKFVTKTHKFGGKHPVWDQTFSIPKTTEEIMQVQIYDKDRFKHDDYIAEAAVPVSSFIQGGRHTTWIPLTNKGRDGGRLLIETEFLPDKKQHSHHHHHSKIDQPMTQSVQQNKYLSLPVIQSQVMQPPLNMNQPPGLYGHQNFPYTAPQQQPLYPNMNDMHSQMLSHQPQFQLQQQNGYQQPQMEQAKMAPPTAFGEGMSVSQQFQGMPQQYQNNSLYQEQPNQKISLSSKIQQGQEQFINSQPVGYVPQEYNNTQANMNGMYPQFNEYYMRKPTDEQMAANTQGSYHFN